MHLGNGAHALIRRHPNDVRDQLADDRLAAGFIFDGHHLPPAVMRTVVRAKGVERTILVSDAVSVAGQAAGRYRLFDGIEVDLRPNGRLGNSPPPRWRATTALPTCVGNAIRHAGVSARDAIRMVTTNPSRLLGLGWAAWSTASAGRDGRQSDAVPAACGRERRQDPRPPSSTGGSSTRPPDAPQGLNGDAASRAIAIGSSARSQSRTSASSPSKPARGPPPITSGLPGGGAMPPGPSHVPDPTCSPST